MSKLGITRISTSTNAAVVQLPERKYPGVVIQGDSLQNLYFLINDARRQVESGNVIECRDVLDELSELVAGYLQSYNEAIEKKT